MPDALAPHPDDLAAWSAGGASLLCGRTNGLPLAPTARLMPRIRQLVASISDVTARMGARVVIDPVSVLTERAAIAGLSRQGSVSCGGGSHLVRAADDWIAVSLPRADDVAMLPAWLGTAAVANRDEAFDRLHTVAARRSARHLTTAALELGLAAAVVGSTTTEAGPPAIVEPLHDRPPIGDLEQVRVVDFSSLWAGPLCTRILADAGATVVKVESTNRPDGARLGPAPFFDVMNAGKRSVAVDFGTASGRALIARLVSWADVVVEASRPRALAALGLDTRAVLGGRPRVWASITGYGRMPPHGDRIAFGDDGAAAGGAVLVDDEGPMFCGDALADPLSGLAAAEAVLDALQRGTASIIDVALARSAAAVARIPGERARPALGCGVMSVPEGRGTAASLGADTAVVMRWLAE